MLNERRVNLMKIELTESNYMQALLRAAVLLGDMHRTIPIHEITISGFLVRCHERKLYSSCKIITCTEHEYSLATTTVSEPAGDDYLILYPIYPPLFFF